MKKEIDSIVKSYYEEEVSEKKAPPMPEFNRKAGLEDVKSLKGSQEITKNLWGNILIAACVLGSFFLILNPSTYDNPLRRAYIPMNAIEAVKEEIPRVIFNAFENYKVFKS